MAAAPRLPPLKLFINNEFVDSVSKKTFPVISPSTEEEICRVAEADKADVDIAVSIAKTALKEKWSTTGPGERQRLLLKLADLLEQNAEELAVLESYNNGSPVNFQKAVVQGCPSIIRYHAGWTDKVDGRVPPVEGPFFVYTRREPIGVCGIILPWNVPVWAILVKLAPCLAMGNVAIVKPAEQTPLTALRIAELIKEAGFPPGVVNILPGYGAAGSAISHHMDIEKVAFTGSTEVGRLILEASAKSNLKKIQLELGGKSPLVIFSDADVNFAARTSSIGVFTNNGQLCTASSRCFVHEDIYDSFVETLTKLAGQNKIGDQLDTQNSLGPLVDRAQFEKVLSFLENGKKSEAKLKTGGSRHGQKGYFVEPTIFTEVAQNNPLFTEEIFGPVQVIVKFKTVEEVAQMANNTTYGLAAGIITNNISNVFSLANKIKAGTVWVNTYHLVPPNVEFGGFKQSGFGKEGGVEGVTEWTLSKTVVVSTLPAKV